MSEPVDCMESNNDLFLEKKKKQREREAFKKNKHYQIKIQDTKMSFIEKWMNNDENIYGQEKIIENQVSRLFLTRENQT